MLDAEKFKEYLKNEALDTGFCSRYEALENWIEEMWEGYKKNEEEGNGRRNI